MVVKQFFLILARVAFVFLSTSGLSIYFTDYYGSKIPGLDSTSVSFGLGVALGALFTVCCCWMFSELTDLYLPKRKREVRLDAGSK